MVSVKNVKNKNMKTIEIAVLLTIIILMIGLGVIFSSVSSKKDMQRRIKCIDSGGIYMPYTRECETKYDVCLEKLKYTFSNLSDTWGVNTNNQDTISKTIQSEIERCIENIK